MTFKEHAQLDEFIQIGPILQGARLLSSVATRAGWEYGKTLAPFPIGGIKGAIGSTVLTAIATKYGIDSIIKQQNVAERFVMDTLGVSAAIAEAIIEKIVVTVGVITLGMLLLALVPAKNRKKVLDAFKNIKKKTTIKMSDIKVIGKKIKNAKNV